MIGWDLCHSIGAIPHNFRELDADFAVWCNYKYLNGGPGAAAGLYINKKYFDRTPGLAGWHGNRKETQFDMKHQFEPADYAGGWQTGTQHIMSMAPLEGLVENIRGNRYRQHSGQIFKADRLLDVSDRSQADPIRFHRREPP